MASQGPNFPTTATGNTSDFGSGSLPNWVNPQFIEANDGSSATVSMPSVNTQTMDLIGRGFNFSIPANAIINGIQLNMSASASVNGMAEMTVILLLKNGGGNSANKSVDSFASTTPTVFTYGGPSDLWGVLWTPANINGANFGALLSAFDASGAVGTLSVDYFQITVTYSVPTPTSSMFQMF